MGASGKPLAATPSDTSGNVQLTNDFEYKTKIDVSKDIMKKTDTQTLKSILDHVSGMVDKYPDLLKSLKSIDVRGRVNTLASTNGILLGINTAYFGDPNTVSLVYDASVDSGYHPKGTTWENIVDHEMGHVATYGVITKIHNGNQAAIAKDWADGSINSTASKIVHQAMDEVRNNYQAHGYAQKPTYAQLRKELSGYATKNWHETIAEAWADYHANGDNARAISKRIYMAMLNY